MRGRRSTRSLVLGVAALLGACACSSPAEPTETRRAPEPSAAARPVTATAPAEAEVPLVRGSRPIMSTIYQVTVVSGDEPRAQEAIAAALDEVERLGVVLSEWRPDSEVSRINEAAGQGTPVHVGPDTLENLRASLQIAEWTGGAYDVTWAALRGLYLFQPNERRVPTPEEIAERLPLVGWRDVRLDTRASTVSLARPGMAIGLGGIAKGYAVDRASAILQERGFEDFMIFGGGQVLVHGLRGGRPWRVGIQHPRASSYIGFLEVTNASIATSGDYEHAFVTEDGRRWHHIIDLATGLPSSASTSVTLVAPSGLLADGLDTGCFVMGPERCLAMLERLPERVEAAILGPDLKLWTTPGMRERLIMRTTLDDQGRIPPR